jgi:HrpA-like RNA helicase
LQLFVLGVRDVAAFPFLEAPRREALDGAVEELRRRQLADGSDGSVSSLGRLLASLPVDLALGT